MRKVINLNPNWKFSKLDESDAKDISYDDRNWEELSLPHTWNAIDGANGNEYYRGACWYRKVLTLPALDQNKRVFIEFQGANSVADVYLNGRHLGRHRGGYSTFRFDLTAHFAFGRPNVLAVKVDNSDFEDVYPLRADFTFYGGIYRDVNLIVVHPVHVDLLDHGSSGVYVVQEEVSEDVAKLRLHTRITNDLREDSKARLWIELLDQTGRPVGNGGAEVNLNAGETQPVDLAMIMKKPILWNGLENAYLYQARVSLQRHNDTVDEVVIPFGVRYFHVDPNRGLYLNGRNIRLNGVARHQDRKDMGWAITHQEHDEDMAFIKEIGANSIRLAHYQHDQYFYDLCDRAGMVVWAEIPFITQMSQTDLSGENAKSQLVELIRQNFNHPSVLFWGIQNEIQIGSKNAEKVRQVVRELNELAKQEDPTRLTTMANMFIVDEKDEYNYMTDVIGHNKYYGWYNGKTEDFAPWLDNYHAINPHTCLCISEYGAEGIIEYHSDQPVVKDYTEEYHALYHEKVWKIFAERSYLWATYVWNMFDFGANVRDEGGVKGRNNKGLVTYDRKVRKDAFYMYKAHWSREPFVHIAGKRYVERASEKIDLKVYTNCKEVALIVNGNKIGTLSGAGKIVIFKDVALGEGRTHIETIAHDGNQTFKDQAWFEKVAEANPSYSAPVEDKGEMVANWFKLPEADDNEPLDEVEIPDGVYSSRDTIQDLMAHEETRKAVIQILGDLTQAPMYGMMEGFKLDVLASMDSDGLLFNKRVINKLNRELVKIKKEV
ncbi:glycoside hydrolase family 2 TIM barrel-domain containing protein [Paenibacillus macerans]|uniref:glycoside hydrolase family 2 protein n=1 Tax=Paenibacillus macerans TaxID=44252 RepID=UPI002E205255|nr:glycoside hydrolase family 2 TIM barrel-domain containing protein [Paenibacillus macerans]MED4953736.1 glycoside hydrolase family 2 TIM barrel-domain containing protein [Paenibacillus macerans]